MKFLTTLFAFFLTLSSVIANPAWYKSNEGIDNVSIYLQKNYVQKARKIYDTISVAFKTKSQQLRFAHQDYKSCTYVVESEKECFNGLQNRLYNINKDASDQARIFSSQIQDLVTKKKADTTFVAPRNSDAEFVLEDIESEFNHYLENAKSLILVLK